MASDELGIILEDVREKFDTVIEGINMVNERLDRHEKAEEERFQRLEFQVLEIRQDVKEKRRDVNDIRKDLNDHRDNTELHAGKKRERA